MTQKFKVEVNMSHKVIIDGDWSGHEMEIAAVLAAHGKAEILGATCVFGNASHDQIIENARDLLYFLKLHHIPVYKGEKAPSDSVQLEGDNAFSSNGLRDVKLEKSTMPYEEKHSVDFILEQLKVNDSKTITITASGPLTNIAKAYKLDPVPMERVKEIIIMGGCTHDMQAHDIAVRRGNITHFGEFNFQQAAKDASDIMNSGLPITLLPMNCTHQLTFTPERQVKFENLYQSNSYVKDALVNMMLAPAHLDLAKFNSAPVMHDIHCGLYILYPEVYKTVKGDVIVTPKDDIEWPYSRTGYTEFIENQNGKCTVAIEVKDPDQLFDIFLESMTYLVPTTAIDGVGNIT